MRRTLAAVLLLTACAAGQSPVRTQPKPVQRPVSTKRSATEPAEVKPALNIPKLPDLKINAVEKKRVQPASLTMGLEARPPKGFSPLKTTQFTLGNGMNAVLHEDRRVPWVTGSLRLPMGAFFDPPLKAGVSELTLRSMRNGAVGARDDAARGAAFETLGAVA
jgi:hypothetical protein